MPFDVLRFLGVCVALLVVSSPASAQGLRLQGEADCQSARGLNPDLCRRLVVEARTFYTRQAPIFTDRQACERRFGRCSLSLAHTTTGRGGARHVPIFAGVQVVAAGSRMTGTPLVGQRAENLNTVLEMNRRPPPGADPQPGGPVAAGRPTGPMFSDPIDGGPAQSFPVPPATLERMRRDAERARQGR